MQFSVTLILTLPNLWPITIELFQVHWTVICYSITLVHSYKICGGFSYLFTIFLFWCFFLFLFLLSVYILLTEFIMLHPIWSQHIQFTWLMIQTQMMLLRNMTIFIQIISLILRTQGSLLKVGDLIFYGAQLLWEEHQELEFITEQMNPKCQLFIGMVMLQWQTTR